LIYNSNSRSDWRAEPYSMQAAASGNVGAAAWVQDYPRARGSCPREVLVDARDPVGLAVRFICLYYSVVLGYNSLYIEQKQ
jgi:hypothetical protein